jgi:exodeoxyribonuclease VII large subunit
LSGSLEGKKGDVRSLVDKLGSLSPLSILERGYSITRRIPDMIVVKDSGQVKTGDEVRVLLAKGTVDCRVQKTQPGK